jgi:hypothetical protein
MSMSTYEWLSIIVPVVTVLVQSFTVLWQEKKRRRCKQEKKVREGVSRDKPVRKGE